MTNSIILENLTRDDLRSIVSECLHEALKKPVPATSVQEKNTEQPISQQEAIQFLGKTKSTLIKWRKKGFINAHTMGGRVYYMRSELVDALRSK